MAHNGLASGETVKLLTIYILTFHTHTHLVSETFAIFSLVVEGWCPFRCGSIPTSAGISISPNKTSRMRTKNFTGSIERFYVAGVNSLKLSSSQVIYILRVLE